MCQQKACMNLIGGYPGGVRGESLDGIFQVAEKENFLRGFAVPRTEK